MIEVNAAGCIYSLVLDKNVAAGSYRLNIVATGGKTIVKHVIIE